MSKAERFYKIKQEALRCDDCDLGCNRVDGQDPHVFGCGNVDADIMFVSEAPSIDDARQKIPLSTPGSSGKKYEYVLKYLGLNREDVYTTSAVVCSPLNNRNPVDWELAQCRQFLHKQIDLVQPKLVVTFGRIAAQTFKYDLKITRDHGKIYESEEFGVRIYPVYHPSYVNVYAFRSKKEEFKNDIYKLKKIVGKL